MAKPKSASFSLWRVSSSNRFSAVWGGEGMRRGSGVEGEACGRMGRGRGEWEGSGRREEEGGSARREWNGMGGDWNERGLEGNGAEGEEKEGEEREGERRDVGEEGSGGE